MLHWSDETLIVWLQNYPSVKPALVKILVRRYKNLLYKEMAKQCDHRYDREDLAQQILFIFVQLLEEYDVTRGIPVAGFLKAKLPNRIYNFFKSQVKIWVTELSDGDSSDDKNGYELSPISIDSRDFWKEVCLYLPRHEFELLYWRFQCEYNNDEIAILTGIPSRNEVIQKLEAVITKLRNHVQFLQKFHLPMTDSKSKIAQDSGSKMTFFSLCKKLVEQCGVVLYTKDMLAHQKVIDGMYTEKDLRSLQSIRALVRMILKQCNLTKDGMDVIAPAAI